MLKGLTIGILGFISGVFGNFMASWLQPGVEGLLGKDRVTWGAIFAGSFLVLILLLEIPRALPWNWWWHRLWFLIDIAYHSPWEKHSARLHLAPLERNAAGTHVEVIDNGERKDLVDVLYSIAVRRTNTTHGALVLGEPGSGKSTGLQQLQLRLARQGIKRLGFVVPIPILTELGAYLGESDLFEFMTRFMLERAPNSNAKVIAHGLRHLAKKGCVVLLLDALDEALGERRISALNTIESFVKNRATNGASLRG